MSNIAVTPACSKSAFFNCLSLLRFANAVLNFTAGRDRKAATHAECLLRDLEHRCGLLTFVFGYFNEPDHLAHQIHIRLLRCGNLFRRLIVLNVRPKDRVENLVRRQRVRVLLAGPKLR